MVYLLPIFHPQWLPSKIAVLMENCLLTIYTVNYRILIRSGSKKLTLNKLLSARLKRNGVFQLTLGRDYLLLQIYQHYNFRISKHVDD